MPRGDTKIKQGDYVTIFAIPEKIHEVEQFLELVQVIISIVFINNL